jgi:hypothetical protein
MQSIIGSLRDWVPAIVGITCGVIIIVGGPNEWSVARAPQVGEIVVLDDFELYGNSRFPLKWAGASSDAQKVYRIETEPGNHFLRARADNTAAQINLEHRFNPKKFQNLQWRWHVRGLPVAGKEKIDEPYHGAAQVYVIFDHGYWPRVIHFIWSASLPHGTRFTNPLYDRGRTVVLRSGPANGAAWLKEKVNFYAEYKKFFGNEPGRVQGIGILTSSDSTKSLVIADYDDLILLP